MTSHIPGNSNRGHGVRCTTVGQTIFHYLIIKKIASMDPKFCETDCNLISNGWLYIFYFLLQDFVVSAVLTFMWLVASSAWADGVNDLKYYSGYSEITLRHVPECGEDTNHCEQGEQGNYANLNVSIVSFLCLCFLKCCTNLRCSLL